MCVCNREGGVVGVAEERKCKMCVRNRGDQGSLHTHYYTLSFCGHTKSNQKYNIDGVVGVAEERKCKMCVCVCNREGGVVG